mmetsp:Transcript_121831/g.289684  ORF Transcript_121831/g.289684 Transcript_121831/m.289684 type:complete len:903 (-) Transcript_121831:33-2741(-)
MVILESAFATAAAGMAPGAATKVYEYNRDNFMEDREQRMKKEFNERKYRVIQAQLWRQDVRDFISLTEQKMSLYLIINVLLLSFTVTMWVEGQLPETTPDWLVIGYQIASVVAFSYLVLTIWLAMHAAVAAQSYQTRVLTQLVRLPIPTWKELEACRTAGSEFEKLESRQMFRVPFVTGTQEGHVPGHTAAMTTPADTESGNTGGPDEQVDASIAADPWGLEQRGDSTYELSTYGASEIAELRHIKLLRQAAVYWQTYDAFARVSMSVGINQLMLGMSYYILGYAMLETKAPAAALAGIVAFMGSAEVVARVDLTLPTGQQRLVQCLVAIGPLFSYMASYLWTFHREETELAELLAPLAYISNGVSVGIMTVFVHVTEQENGAMVPNAFKSVLFLDVFGWVSRKGEKENAKMHLETTQAMVPANPQVARKPAASAVQYDSYCNSLPSKPVVARPGENEDMRYLPGAPRAWESVNAIEPPAKDFWDAVTFMPPGSRQREKVDDLLREEQKDTEDFANFGISPSPSNFFMFVAPEAKDEDIVTGHEQEAPGAAPWRIFRNMSLITSILWIFAGVWAFMCVAVPQLIDIGLAFEDEIASEIHHPPSSEHAKLAPVHTGLALGEHRSSLLNLRVSMKSAKFQAVDTTWPYSGFRATGLSCDTEGGHLLVTDGVSTFLAAVKEAPPVEKERIRLRHSVGPTITAEFAQVPCSAALGERLQDTALACFENATCEALVLHQQGQRLASCHMNGGSSSLSVASHWQSAGEKASFVMLDPACLRSPGADLLSPGCTSVGTSKWRSARLQRGARGDDLVPADVLEEKEKDLSRGPPKSMRLMTERYLGVLNSDEKFLELLDLDNGGATSAKLPLNTDMSLEGFCISSTGIFFLGGGSRPKLLRLPIQTPLRA